MLSLAAVDHRSGLLIREINSFPGSYFGLAGNPDLRANTWRAAFFKLVEAALEDGARKHVVFDYPYDELRATVLRQASSLDAITSPCLVHWDAWNPNFFVRDGQVVGIIDFERAIWAEPLMEAQFRPLFSEGVNHSMPGYGKTTFTFEEEQRCQLYSLYLGLVMHVECFYRNYDSDAIYNLSRQFIGATMDWLKAN